MIEKIQTKMEESDKKLEMITTVLQSLTKECQMENRKKPGYIEEKVILVPRLELFSNWQLMEKEAVTIVRKDRST